MNKFALTTIAALPGSGGGCAAWQAPEVVRKEARPATCSKDVHDAVYMEEGKVSEHAEDALLWGYASIDSIKRAEWKRNNYMALYGNKAAQCAAKGWPMNEAKKLTEAELEEYFSSRN